MANPKSLEARQAFIDQNPFDGFKISDNTLLNELHGRHPCPKCGKSRKFFCYTCYVPLAELEKKIPQITLPIQIDIIKHKHEIDGKSTAGHAAILCPDYVTVYTYPDIPDYVNENAVLIFPSFRAVTVEQLFKEGYSEFCKSEKNLPPKVPKGCNPSTLMKHILRDENSTKLSLQNNTSQLPIKKAVFIDSTWNQSKGIYKDERIQTLPCVVLQNRVSQFWRHQKGSPRWYLATVEAVHQFLIEVHIHLWGINPEYRGLKNCFSDDYLLCLKNDKLKNCDTGYRGQYDDLLYFFQHMYNLIHAYYDHDNLYAYKRRLL